MSIRLNVRRDELLGEGSYRAVLRNLDEKETPFGPRLRWLFEVAGHGTEVAGFTSLSESNRANAYVWATALNEEIRTKKSWCSEDVVGRECVLDLSIGEDGKGREKNKVRRVSPMSADK